MTSLFIALILAECLRRTDRPADDMSRPAKPVSSPPTWVSPDDYPTEAILKKAEGTAVVRFRILRNGGVGACDVDNSSGSEILDAMTCALIKVRGRYNPELDARGNAVESVKTMRFTWRLPADKHSGSVNFGRPYRFEMIVDTDAAGLISDCRISDRVGPIPMPPGDPCLPIRERGHAAVLRDAKGELVPSRLTFSMKLMQEPR